MLFCTRKRTGSIRVHMAGGGKKGVVQGASICCPASRHQRTEAWKREESGKIQDDGGRSSTSNWPMTGGAVRAGPARAPLAVENGARLMMGCIHDEG